MTEPTQKDLEAAREPLLPMRHCFNCGAELGRYRFYMPLDHCPSEQCVQEAHRAAAKESAP
jgi:hypothetical protein